MTNVRRGTPSDTAQLLDMLGKLTPTEKYYLAYESKGGTLRQCISSGTNIFVVEVDGKIAGFSRYSVNKDNAKVLEELFISPKFRRKGAGRALLSYMKQNLPGATLKTKVDNDKIIGMVSSMGYVKDNNNPYSGIHVWKTSGTDSNNHLQKLASRAWKRNWGNIGEATQGTLLSSGVHNYRRELNGLNTGSNEIARKLNVPIVENSWGDHSFEGHTVGDFGEIRRKITLV